jgi:hypothetical protein
MEYKILLLIFDKNGNIYLTKEQYDIFYSFHVIDKKNNTYDIVSNKFIINDIIINDIIYEIIITKNNTLKHDNKWKSYQPRELFDPTNPMETYHYYSYLNKEIKIPKFNEKVKHEIMEIIGKNSHLPNQIIESWNPYTTGKSVWKDPWKDGFHINSDIVRYYNTFICCKHDNFRYKKSLIKELTFKIMDNETFKQKFPYGKKQEIVTQNIFIFIEHLFNISIKFQ